MRGKVKRFIALWVVCLVFAALAGGIVGAINYWFTTGSPDPFGVSNVYWWCSSWGNFSEEIGIEWIDLKTCYQTRDSHFVHPIIYSTSTMLWLYPVFRAVVTSFKVVFSQRDK